MSFIIALLFIFLITELILVVFAKDSNFERPDLAVVLGCGSQVNKPLLNDRLERAVEFHKIFPEIPILLTGDEKNKSEITSMSNYLKNKIPQAQLILDPNSLRTWDSFVFIKDNYPNANLLIITNEFHQRRSLFFAKLLKLSARRFGKDLNYSHGVMLFIRERLARLIIYKHLF